jgi:hypothetical protein
MAELYHAKVRDLHRAQADKVDATAALEAVRGLIDRVVLSPALDGKGLEIELIGEIASMIDMALERKSGSKPESAAADRDLFLRSVKVVAGRCCHLYRTTIGWRPSGRLRRTQSHLRCTKPTFQTPARSA